MLKRKAQRKKLRKNKMDETAGVKKLVGFRDEIRSAKKLKCSCSGFVLQYDGCSCEKKKEVAKATKKFWDYMDSL